MVGIKFNAPRRIDLYKYIQPKKIYKYRGVPDNQPNNQSIPYLFLMNSMAYESAKIREIIAAEILIGSQIEDMLIIFL